MAMSDSTPSPVSIEISSRSEYVEAINRVISKSSNSIRIFEYNLEEGGFNTSERFELLRSFLLKNRQNRLMIILHDVDYIVRYCPRMMTLLTQFSHAIDIHQSTPEARRTYDPFVIGDDRHYVHRFHFDSPRAKLGLDDTVATHPLLDRFEEIWMLSSPAVFSTTLGL
jgi:hypothetical protein